MRAAQVGSRHDPSVVFALRTLLVIAAIALVGMLTGVVPMPVALAMIIVAVLGLLATGVAGLTRAARR
jgi:hypothetical protein